MNEDRMREVLDNGDPVVVVTGVNSDGSVGVLSSYGGIRVYTRDKLDGRLTLLGMPPYFHTVTGAIVAFEGENPPKVAQVSLVSALRMFKGEQFADFTEPSHAG